MYQGPRTDASGATCVMWAKRATSACGGVIPPPLLGWRGNLRDGTFPIASGPHPCRDHSSRERMQPTAKAVGSGERPPKPQRDARAMSHTPRHFTEKNYSEGAGSGMGREKERTMNPPTATAEESRMTRKYCAAGKVASPKTVRSRPKLALQAHRRK